MEFIVALVTEVAKCAISPIKKHIKYFFNLGNNVQSLNDEDSKLKAKKESIQDRVDEEKRKRNKIKSNVENWLTAVNNKISDVEKVNQSYEEEAKKKCFIGLCPNLKARYKLSRKVEEEEEAVKKLVESGNFDNIAYCPTIQEINNFLENDFKAFESRRRVLNGIMDALKEADINIIGVHGMGGVGKTTLVKEVARQVKETKLFDSVVLATVTQTPNVGDIQKRIAFQLDFQFVEQSTTDDRATQLREILKKEKILVVLDDIWERLDLDKVGIPSGDAQQGLKILLTSRDRDVLLTWMDSKRDFGIGMLTREEAWDLFQKMAGDCVQSHDLQDTAIKVAEKCGGLPIAIATVGKALKNKRLFVWKDALRELESPSSTRLTQGTITAEVYSAIELSYRYLQSEGDKMTFLLCSFIGHNGSIDSLLRYIMGLGLYDNINKIDEARNKVLSVVAKLKDSYLLQDSYDDGRFDIHDVVREVALSIAPTEHMFVRKNGVELKEWPSNEILSNCKTIALLGPIIKTELPDQFECPNLSFFFFKGHYRSPEIPAGFFKQTKRLKVLSLMFLPSLPVTINLPHSLHTLCLDACTLKDITVIGELKNLETLSLARSNIEALPEELTQLTRLKLLDLSDCSDLITIPPNVLSRLFELEELYMYRSFVGWEDEVVGNERRNASLEELNCLPNLTTLYLDISVHQKIPEWLLEKNLDRYRIFNGYDWMDEFKRSEYSKMLKLQLYTNISSSCAMKMLVKNTELLFLEPHDGVKNVLDELNIGKDFPHLKKLYIQKGSDVEFITTEKTEFSQLEYMRLEDLPRLMGFCYEQNTSQQGEEGAISKALPLFNKQYAFPRLKELELRWINVRSVWQSNLPEMSDCISNLTRLIISNCDKLEHLFSPCVARCLQQLKKCEIEGCKCLREIISIQEMEIEENKDIKAVIRFPQLTSLKINDLRDLTKFCSGNYIIEFPFLKELKINNCPELQEFISSEPKMQALFNKKVAIPNIEKMTLSKLRNVKMIFHKELVEGSFCKLEELIVEYCGELSTVFPSNISFGVFQNMKKLSVRKCDSLEVIFEVGKETHVIESQLKDLAIQFSHGLKKIWNRDPHGTLSFQSLSRVEVRSCECLQNVFPASIAKNLPQLENLGVVSCGVKEIVWEGLNSEDLTFKFPLLSSLELRSLKQLKSLYGGRGKHAIVFHWPMLRRLDTDYSTLLKMVIPSQHQDMKEEAESVARPFSFPQQAFVPKLEELCLSNFKDVESATFPISLLQRFDSLESFQLSHCDLKDVDVVVDAVGTLSTITKMKLYWCQNLKRLSSSCFQNLTTLEVCGCEMMINLVTASSSSSACFQNLTTLEVSSCDMMINLVTASVAQNLKQLTTMKMSWCKAMTEIVAKEGDNEDGSTSIRFSKLKSIHLVGLESLTSFCGSLNYNFEFPSLEECIVERCPNMKVFCHGVISTPCLHRVRESKSNDKGHWGGELNTTIQQMYAEKVGCIFIRLELSDKYPELMEIWNGMNPQQYLSFRELRFITLSGCSSLKHGFTSSIALSLNNLWELEVKECINMEQIIWDERHEVEETTYNDIMFSELKTLNIKSCANLQSFYLGSALQFLNIKTMKIKDCPKMMRFISSEKKIRDVNGGSRSKEKLRHVDLNIEAFFHAKVAIPNLEKMMLSQLRNVKMIFHNELVEGSFFKLEEMTVEDCGELLTVFPSNISFRAFQNLKKLSVQGCDSLEVIFEIGEEIPVVESQLKDLAIQSSSGLKQICNRDLHGTLSFQSLSSVDVRRCESLQNVFPASIAKNLPQLENLKVVGCGVKEVVWEGLNSEEQLSSLTFKFPRLSSLYLENLEQLKSLYGGRGKHAIVFDWPMLRRLDTDYSTLLKMVSSQNQEMNEEAESVSHPFFFPQQVIVPKLEELCLSNFKDVESATFPISLLQRFDSLESLQLSHCDLKDVEDVVDAGITKLKLDHCQNLKLLSSSSSCLQNLTTLEVCGCEMVINLVAASSLSSSCFQNLTTLEVYRCEMMINLVTASVAQNLGQLTTMKISRCETMTEIVAKEGDDEDGSTSIRFSKLKSIHLYDLQSLTSFCGSLNYTFEFPSLKECIVQRCPSIKVFCQGVLSTPCLHSVRELKYDDKGHWTGELNTTMQQMYAEKVGYRNVIRLELSDKYPELMEIWNGMNPQQYLNFKELRFITLSGCCSLKHGFTSSIALSLKNLWTLEVKECINMEQVIWDECHEMEETTYNDIMFSKLNTLNIESCANLQSFYLGSDILQFPNIQTMKIKDCQKMMRFISSEKKMRDVYDGSGIEEKLHHVDLNIQPFFHDKVECPQLQTLELSSLNIHKIWSDQLQAPSLVSLSVKNCHNLKYLFPSLMVREFVKLKYVEIRDCESLEEVISMEELTEEESMSFPALEKLTLKQLPKLTRFCSQNNLEVDKSAFFNEKVVFPSLEELKVNGIRNCRMIWLEQLYLNSFCELKDIEIESCAMLPNIFPFNMMERLSKLKKLQIVNCGSVEEIFDSKTLVSTQSIVTEIVTKFMFPRVKYLRFDKLPNLKSFYSSKHATEWPSLKTLMVTECPKVEIFASEYHDFRQSQIEISNVQQPLFWVNEVTFPILEDLRLKQNDTMKGTWLEQLLPTVSFKNLRVIDLSCIPDKMTALSYCFIKALPDLEKLTLSKASFCEIFQFEEVDDDERHASTFSQLIELRLSTLPELTHLWKEQFQPTPILYNLNILEVLDCGKLKTLVPCWISFRNLISLKVSKCDRIINLIACSAAKSMRLLREMTISDCKMIKEIIECECDDKEGSIVFSQLEHLELSNLPSLSSFCLGEHNFEFPFMTKVIVRECPTIENFCQGDLNTPYLRKVWVMTADEGRWKGDLKTTIKQLVREMNVQISEATEVTFNCQNENNTKMLWGL